MTKAKARRRCNNAAALCTEEALQWTVERYAMAIDGKAVDGYVCQVQDGCLVVIRKVTTHSALCLSLDMSIAGLAAGERVTIKASDMAELRRRLAEPA